MHVSVCLLMLLYFGSSQQSTSGSSHHSVLYEVRKQIKLECEVPDFQNITVVWRKVGSLSPLAVGGKVLGDERRYSVARDNVTEVMTIEDAVVADAGVYECSYSEDRLVFNTSTFVVRRRDKSFTSITSSKLSVKATPGDDVSLPCTVQRRHRHKVVWLDQYRRVVSIGNKSLRLRFKVHAKQRKDWTLIIKRVRKTDYGVYTCVVTSDPAVSHSITLRKRVPHVASKTSTEAHFNISTVDSTLNQTDGIKGDYFPREFPNIGASHSLFFDDDKSRDHLILGVCLGGFFIITILVSSCYMFHRVQKTTRRIVQQEIQLDHTRMRRRERRLNSETQVYISRSCSRQDSRRLTDSNVDKGVPCSPPRGKSPYCEPWSSNNDILAAMTAACRQREASYSHQEPMDDHGNDSRHNHRAVQVYDDDARGIYSKARQVGDFSDIARMRSEQCGGSKREEDLLNDFLVIGDNPTDSDKSEMYARVKKRGHCEDSIPRGEGEGQSIESDNKA